MHIYRILIVFRFIFIDTEKNNLTFMLLAIINIFLFKKPTLLAHFVQVLAQNVQGLKPRLKH